MFLSKASSELPLVFEFGSLNTRVGYAGEDAPTIIQSTSVGVELGPTEEKKAVFDISPYTQHATEYMIKNPLLNNYVYDWELMELIIKSLGSKLGATFERSPTLIAEPAVHNKDFRLNFVELLFEKFNVPSVFFHKAPLLSLYAFARENSLMVDVGAEHIYCTPIQDGLILEKGVMRADVGSEFITRKLLEQVESRETKTKMNCTYRTPSLGKCKIINDSVNYETFCKLEFMREVKHAQCKVLEYRLEKL